jgi:hypothetical protein
MLHAKKDSNHYVFARMEKREMWMRPWALMGWFSGGKVRQNAKIQQEPGGHR